ncbi:hypothetical protein [Desertivirga arenae]|uniref:hypothetical protein n=1 Tax=Desertivirga arenae TaxID=2810309 RepID=UPI001A979B44|nr:hypothetical protein [Pedobacter sp. SYSU D00823]
MEKFKEIKQPWLNSVSSDTIFILLPPFLALFIVGLFPTQFKESDAMPALYWLILIVFVDVAHVYSTLYRTYFNPRELKAKKSLLVAVPLFCYVISVVFYSLDQLLFWRVLAYLAVFHFIRQQYGIMRLYSRNEKEDKLSIVIDSLTIYSATLYPICFWHLNPNRNFNWFIENDFLRYPLPFLSLLFAWVYVAVLILYILKEITLLNKHKQFNVPKNILILGTVLSWYFGIVYYNGDMAFTTLNVLSHGIPYMALIWFFEKKRYSKEITEGSKVLKFSFGKYGVVVFILILASLAYAEEGLWDGLIWKEHNDLFPVFSILPKIEERQLLSLLVPLLALPQSTHYVLDGFIWKIRKKS